MVLCTNQSCTISIFPYRFNFNYSIPFLSIPISISINLKRAYQYQYVINYWKIPLSISISISINLLPYQYQYQYFSTCLKSSYYKSPAAQIVQAFFWTPFSHQRILKLPKNCFFPWDKYVCVIEKRGNGSYSTANA